MSFEQLDKFNNFGGLTISGNGIDIQFKEIEQYIVDLAPDFFVDDLLKCPTPTFKALLRCAGYRFFRHSKILINLAADPVAPGIVNYQAYNYNYKLLSTSCLDLFNYLCEKYNKVKSVEIFIALFNLVDDFPQVAASNPDGMRLLKKLKYTRKESIKTRLIDSPSIVGTITVFNDENQQPDMGADFVVNNQQLINSINENIAIEKK